LGADADRALMLLLILVSRAAPESAQLSGNFSAIFCTWRKNPELLGLVFIPLITAIYTDQKTARDVQSLIKAIN